MKMIIAREWLYLLGGLLFGLIAAPVFTALLGVITAQGTEFTTNLMQLYKYLFRFEQTTGWIFVMTPYLLFQLVRSILWATKASKRA